jgi:glutamate N-acetyltransferase/amino-acid N-acetyltransferase
MNSVNELTLMNVHAGNAKERVEGGAGQRSHDAMATGMLPDHDMQELPGGITAPKGFRAAGIHCGVKKSKKDLCLVVSDAPASAAVVLTTNRVQAAPVLVTREQMEHSHVFRAIVVNSGNANACTGDRGMNDARAMVGAAASALNVGHNEVLVSSTGVIGQFLPIAAITKGIKEAAAVLSTQGGASAAEAIVTTDTFVKEYALEFDCNGARVRMGGMAKGSGMIAPNMATMLAFVSTDAAVSPEVLRAALSRAADRSFNRISVDGDTSTNDMVAVLANGLSGSRVLTETAGAQYEAFYCALEKVLIALSKMIVKDGEGATKFIEINVTGAEVVRIRFHPRAEHHDDIAFRARGKRGLQVLDEGVVLEGLQLDRHLGMCLLVLFHQTLVGRVHRRRLIHPQGERYRPLAGLLPSLAAASQD